jgi:hypothetical protein
MSVSQTRTDLMASVSARVATLGHLMTSDEIEAIVNDVQKVIVNDNATAIADCTADVATFPQDPQVLGGD